MRLSAQEEYGLRCLLQVAGVEGDRLVQISTIAEAEGLSSDYTAKLLRVLRQGGLVESTRGAAGGYRLARPADQITVWEAVEVLDGHLFDEGFCQVHTGQGLTCVHSTACSIRSLWKWVGSALEQVLDAITLADLARGEVAVAARLARISETEGTTGSTAAGPEQELQ